MTDTTDHTHKVDHRPLRRGSVVYEPGDTLTPTDAELNAFGDNLVELTPETAFDEASIADELDAGHPSPEEFTEMPVREYRDYLGDNDLSPEYLEAMLSAELAADSPRSTVIGALEDRLASTE